MYFLTNNEGLIIAASNSFLSVLGSRDVCSISTMMHNKLISLNEEDSKLDISNKNLIFNYSKVNMYSAFGELTIYSLSKVKEKESFNEEDENIAYLKKIKEGTINSVDNEYAIPDIPVLHQGNKEFTDVEINKAKDEIEDNIDKNREIKEFIEDIEPATEQKIEIDKSIDKLAEEIVEAEENNNVEIKDNKIHNTSKKIEIEKIDENTNNFIEELKEITPKVENKDVIENIEIADTPEVVKALEEEKNVEVSIKVPEIKIEDDTKKILEEIQKVKDEESIVEEIKSIKEPEPYETSIKEDINEAAKEIKESVTEEKIKLVDDIKEETKDKIEKPESTISKIKKKLFPWGKKSDTIELEDKDYEIDLKTANEIEPKEESNIETVVDRNKEITVEPEIIEPSLEEETEDKEVNIEDKLTNEDTEQKVSEPTTIEIEDTVEKVPELNKQNIDDESKILSLKEQIDKIEIQDNKAKIDIEEPKEKIKEKEIKKEPSNFIKEEKDLTVIEEPKKDKMVYKILASQVDTINLNDNANKLSIDYSSYKMLLENYLDEIEKYNNDLLNGSSSTISMLTDAGELLSLNVLTQKLNNLKNVEDKKHNVNEINLICSLIKEKLRDTKESLKDVEKEKIVEDIEEEKFLDIKETKPVAPPVIPDELIDLTTAEDLLSAINKQDVAFNPNRAAAELNLPKGLIIEFVEDFLNQSKEHLSVLVNAYNSNDIKTIQTTAHMLKGAASNLRLDTIAETLFKIQKESNLDKDASLIKNFVAQIKGLEKEIASMEDAENEN